ncbi:hypothetical protein BCU68_15695 [Vibrio sp. 10N.286.49.B3]|uniref:hypothetical protein n=1 Tax=Vibrio sp. 10N.286.49.B3 TaxID=1880855 RepID=UPI000C844C2E|nr:hypothetical protein [Vibrio sp. 10N.286.49.B3]PMH41399.1 hypothetical protein BCU68_15695 [Vibrio sp. 10N.286.49.B3]
MLQQIITQSIIEFQNDCSMLSQRHYPTIHNQGMKEYHLSVTFARRLQRALLELQLELEPSVINYPLQGASGNEPDYLLKISCCMGNVWVISHHFAHAGTSCRSQLINKIKAWQLDYQTAIEADDLLFIISDHWISRHKSSQELLYWWMGAIPESIEQYTQQGVKLCKSASLLIDDLQHHFNRQPSFMQLGHPLKRISDQVDIKKYIHFYALISYPMLTTSFD